MAEAADGGGRVDGDAARLLEFFRLALRLKETRRAGWALRGVEDAESVADHSYAVALMALVMAPRVHPPLDAARCVALALAHDLAECLVGDITPYDGVSGDEKRRREAAAIATLAEMAEYGEIERLWREYDAGATPEARFVKELDRLETAVQADAYGRAGHGGLHEFRDNARARVATDAARALLDALEGHEGRRHA